MRLDFGIDIEFPAGIRHCEEDHRGCAGRRSALGVIRYSAIDPGAADGVLLYIKAALCGNEPVDVANYALANPPFPHQPTTNQWFSEAQLESYRMLGLHTVLTLTKGGSVTTVADLLRRRRAGRVYGAFSTAAASRRSRVACPSVKVS